MNVTSPGPATKKEPGSAARIGTTACLIGIGLTSVSAIVSAFFMDVREMANTPVPSRIFAASLFLFGALGAWVLVLSAINKGWIHTTMFLRVGCRDHPLGFWGRVFLFAAVGSGMLAIAVLILAGYRDDLFAGH